MFQVDGTTSAKEYEYLTLAINVFIISYFINSFNMFFNIKLVQFISINFIIVPPAYSYNFASESRNNLK